MKIGIDIRCLVEGKRTGVEEYTIQTIKYLFEQKPRDHFVLFYNSFKGDRTSLDWIREHPNAELRDFRFPNKLLNFFLCFFQWPKLDRLIGGVDVFFAPNINFIALSDDCRHILTIHDLSFERLPETFSLKRRLWHFMVNSRTLCRRADEVLAVSESTRQDVISLYGCPKDKVRAVYSPLDFERFTKAKLDEEREKNIRKKYNLKGEVILFLGTVEPRKNIEGLIDAFEIIKETQAGKGLSLVVAGAMGWKYDSILERYKASKYAKDIVFTGFVEDGDKPYLYRLAKVFIYPSLFEGFGFPPLEAMACGVPTVTSNCSSLPEVAGDAALLVDPYRPDEIALAALHLLQDKELYKEYVKRGHERVREMENKKSEISF